jgi:glycerophosphoryl diester phosphodiesterase
MAARGWRIWRPGERTRLDGMDPVIGHRGAAAHAPENTLASIRKAGALGCRWVELDAKLTGDGVPILMHDERLERTTSGRGEVAATTLAEIRRLDAGGWKGPEFAGEPVPTLAEALALLVELGMEVNVEIKPCPGREALTARIVCAEIRRLWPAERPVPLLSSFALESLAVARDTAPELPRGLLVEAIPRDWRELMERLGCVSLNVSQRRSSERRIAAVLAEGVPVLCYTVNDPAKAQALWRLGVTALFSDAPDRIGALAQ